MRLNWRRLMTSLAMAGCVAMLAPACVIRAQGRVRPAYVVSEEPPPPRYQTVKAKPGHVWIRGHWEWRGSKWVWKSGRYERSRANYDWQPGMWEKRGNRWHWVEGRWVAAGTVQVRDHRGGSTPPPRGGGVEVRDHRDNTPPPRGGGVEVRDHRTHPVHPTNPPPAPRADNRGKAPGSGYVWIQGRYEWNNGQYRWVNGHWERARAQMVWEPGRWELRGNHYIWVEGKWVKAKAQGGGGVEVRDHRKKEKPAPPPRKNEKVPARRGTPR